MKSILCLLILTLSTSAIARKNVPRNSYKLVKNDQTKTVKECMTDKPNFTNCHLKLSPKERAVFCGDFKMISSISGNDTASALSLIAEVCLKNAKY